MIKGLLCDEGATPLCLIFICPKCKKEHSCFVDKLHYKNDGANVWAYKDSLETMNVIEIYPSFNNEKKCGWHGPYNWAVEVMKLGKDQRRDVATETWLHNDLEMLV